MTVCFSQTELNAAEAYWVKFFDCINDGYNLREGGGAHGKMSFESRMKMSISRIGNQNGKGWHPTREQIEKQKSTRKRNLNGCDPFTLEARRLAGIARIGSKHSDATKLKMSVSQKARRAREREALKK